MSREYCLALYKTSDYMIHLAWLDHCPNVIVEALSQGCPVICTDSGGTKEIVKDNGIVILETTPYNFELLDYDKPHTLRFDQFSLPANRPMVDGRHLTIQRAADQYEETFND
jgi:glycosyltransferase involved in cell wall biosynthesis